MTCWAHLISLVALGHKDLFRVVFHPLETMQVERVVGLT